MKAPLAVLLTLSIALAACGEVDAVSSTSTSPPQLPERPELAVDQMVAALMLGDVAAIRRLTSDRQLAVIIALEGGGTAELAAMLELGVPDDAATNFWQAFVEGFPELVGESIEDMEFGLPSDRNVAGTRFVSYPVAFDTSLAATEWFVRETSSGWQIDLLATFAGPFATSLESLVRRTIDEEVLTSIREETPAIEAAYQRQVELNRNERVRDALGSLLAVLKG